MSVGIYIRDVDLNGYLVINADGSILFSLTLSDGTRWPNPVAAKEGHATVRQKTMGCNLQIIAADPERPEIEPKVLGEIDDFEEIKPVPLGALSLYCALKRSSKYYGQFSGIAPVTHVIPPSRGDHYCFRAAHNAYRHEDLVFYVKVGAEFCRLDKWHAPKAERRAA